MGSPTLGVPSRAQLLEKIRDKIRNHDQILWPTVSEKIQVVKATKRVEAIHKPDHEHRTVFHIDLDRALLNGLIVDVAQATEPEAGWAVTVKGCDCSGYPLIVVVHLCLEERAPLQIADFLIAKE